MRTQLDRAVAGRGTTRGGGRRWGGLEDAGIRAGLEQGHDLDIHIVIVGDGSRCRLGRTKICIEISICDLDAQTVAALDQPAGDN